MKVLFDQGTPVPLRQRLTEHDVHTAYEQGWGAVDNGALIAAAEAQGFDVLVTTDRNLRYQQNLSSRRIAIVVLSTTSWPRIRAHLHGVQVAVGAARPGSYAEVDIPYLV